MNTLLRYRDKGLITRFLMDGTNKAKVIVRDGNSVVVAMSREYIVSVTDVREVCQADPLPQYFILNDWDTVTPEAKDEAELRGVTMIKFGAFAHRLKKNDV